MTYIITYAFISKCFWNILQSWSAEDIFWFTVLKDETWSVLMMFLKRTNIITTTFVYTTKYPKLKLSPWLSFFITSVRSLKRQITKPIATIWTCSCENKLYVISLEEMFLPTQVNCTKKRNLSVCIARSFEVRNIAAGFSSLKIIMHLTSAFQFYWLWRFNSQ